MNGMFLILVLNEGTQVVLEAVAHHMRKHMFLVFVSKWRVPRFGLSIQVVAYYQIPNSGTFVPVLVHRKLGF